MPAAVGSAHAFDHEWILVEGESAAAAAQNACDPATQSVFAMQGKPINALRRSVRSLRENPSIHDLVRSLSADAIPFDFLASLQRLADRVPAARVLLLFDADADGIHCEALMTAFFMRCLPGWIEAGAVSVCRPPMFQVVATADGSTLQVDGEDSLRRLRGRLVAENIAFEVKRYRGLASIDAVTLRHACIDPATRSETVVDEPFCDMVRRFIG